MPEGDGRGGKRTGAGRPRAPGESFEAARRRKETALADLREHEVRLKKRTVLDADAVTREWEDILRTVRAGVLSVVSRVRAQLPHLTAHDADVIDRELRQALTGVADDAGTSP